MLKKTQPKAKKPVKKTDPSRPGRAEVNPSAKIVETKKPQVEEKLVVKKSEAKKIGQEKKATVAKTGKKDLVEKYQAHKKDTGSTEVQIAVLTKKIESLANHLKKHSKDFDSRRGLLMMVGKRRRLMNYLKKRDEAKYQKLIEDLGLRG